MNKKNNRKKFKENKKQKKVSDYNVLKTEKKQNKKTSKNKNINNMKVISISIIFAFILFYSIYLIGKLITNPTSIFVVTNGQLTQEENTVAYIVREESVVKGENYKNGMVKIKNEGEKVAKGDSVFRYYSSGEEELKNKIAELDIEIQKIMQNEESIFTSDIKLLESQIEKELNLLYKVNSMQEIQEYKKNISTYISKMAKISGERSPSGSYLKQLLDERQEYENKLTSGSEYIEATASGVVSYRVDGLEQILKTDDFSRLNKEFLEDLDLKTGQTIASSEEMGKIINNYESYIIFNTDSDEGREAKVGDEITIRLQNSNIVKAIIENIINEEDNSKTITVKISKNVEELISYRKISLDIIWWSAEGYRIPNSAIREIDGLSYVVRNRNGYYNKMLIKILKQNDEYCIVRQYKTDELKELGFSTTEIYNMKNIALYDEIVIDPTDKQILQ